MEANGRFRGLDDATSLSSEDGAEGGGMPQLCAQLRAMREEVGTMLVRIETRLETLLLRDTSAAPIYSPFKSERQFDASKPYLATSMSGGLSRAAASSRQRSGSKESLPSRNGSGPLVEVVQSPKQQQQTLIGEDTDQASMRIELPGDCFSPILPSNEEQKLQDAWVSPTEPVGKDLAWGTSESDTSLGAQKRAETKSSLASSVSNDVVPVRRSIGEGKDHHSHSTKYPRRASNQSSVISGRRNSTASVSSIQSAESVLSLSVCSRSSCRGNLKFLHTDSYQAKVWLFFEDSQSSVAAFIYKRILMILTLGSVLVPIMQTLDPPLMARDTGFIMEASVDAIFALELLVRWFVSPSPLGFVRNAWNILDIMNIVALTLRVVAFTLLHDDGLSATILLCLVPVLRLLKALRHFSNLGLLVHALSISVSALTVPLFFLLVLVLMFSIIIYLVEPRSNISTLPHSIYLVVVTLSTVGYGDTVPKTNAGQLVCSLVAMCGVLYMAMPLSIVGNAFNETWKDRSLILLLARTRQRLIQWGYTDEELDTLFHNIDGDRSGSIDFTEFQDMLSRLHLRLSFQSTKALFHYFDKLGDDNVQLDDFKNALSLPKRSRSFFGMFNREISPD